MCGNVWFVVLLNLYYGRFYSVSMIKLYSPPNMAKVMSGAVTFSNTLGFGEIQGNIIRNCHNQIS